jgi:hypothetical protein
VTVKAIHEWRDNAALIVDVAELRHLDGTVLDVTFGQGGFWKRLPHDPDRRAIVASDRYTPNVALSYDYRRTGLLDNSFDVVVFDPPYKLNGTPALGDFDDRFGIAGDTNRWDVLQDIALGVRECYRVCSSRLLVKCMDQVEGGQMRWQTKLVHDEVDALGGRLVDRFDMLGGGMPQPARSRKCERCNGTGVDPEPEPGDVNDERPHMSCRMRGCEHGRITSGQQHAYGRGSTLLVFKKPATSKKHRRRP